MKPWIHRIVSSMGLPALARRIFARQGVFVLEFHGTPHRPYPELPPELQPSFTAADLEHALTWIQRRFTFLTPEQIFDPGARGVLLTFDDGFANNAEQALPLLEQLDAPAIFFVTLQHLRDPKNWLPSIRKKMAGASKSWTDAVERDLFDGMSREQLREASRHPLITVGSHTLRHPHLTECTDDALHQELEESREELGELTGSAIDFLAYPYGDYDRRVAEAARAVGYRAAFVEDSRSVGLPRFEIPRVGLYASNSGYLSLKLSGLHRPPWKDLASFEEDHG